MNNSKGTIETVALELVKVFQPLIGELNNENASIFFNRIGVPLSPSQINSVRPAMDAIIDDVQSTVLNTADLLAAIDMEDKDRIINEGKAIASDIKIIIENIQTLASLIDQFNLSGVDASKIPERILNILLYNYIDRLRGLNGVLIFLNVLKIQHHTADPNNPNAIDYTSFEYNFNDLISWLSNPSDQLVNLYDWNTNAFDGSKLFPTLELSAKDFGLPVFYDAVNNILDFVFLNLGPITQNNQKGIAANIAIGTDPLSSTFARDDWELLYGAEFKVQENSSFIFLPDGTVIFKPLTALDVDARLFADWIASKSDERLFLIGIPGGSNLSLDQFSVGLDNHFKLNNGEISSEFVIKSTLTDLRLILSLEDADSFIDDNVGESLFELGVDLNVSYSTINGFAIEGSGGLEINIPLHVKLAFVDLKLLHIFLGVDDSTIFLDLGVDINLDLGPFKAVINDIGFKTEFEFKDDQSGNLGQFDLSMGFKPPNGIGLQIDVSAVKGGGFLYIDAEKGEYAGVAELTIQNTISLKAIGIINTKLPNGEDGFALLLLITAEFTPLQLGFGFTLNGVGGLIGANRGMNLPAIRDGVRNDTFDHILFPDDPVANAPAIISNLNTVFPIAEGNHSFGIMGIIGWGVPTLLEVELGLMITFPSFDLAVIGKLSTSLPDKDAAILKLNVAFAGTMSFEKKYFYFDAAIFDSKLLTFSLSGGMALRILWGDEPNFVLSVGGFHPDFVPPPLELNDLERITLNLLADDNPRLTLQTYFAVTSNTVQFGASIDFLFKFSKFKVVGYFYFHALFQFDPFYFKISIGAGLAVKIGSSTILSVSVSGSLEGPTPWKIKGKGKFKILFIKFTVSFSETWGETRDTSLPGIQVFPKLKEAILDDRNWTALLPQGSTLTSLRDVTDENNDATDQLTIHPFGSLSMLQRVVPLKETIDLFGNQEPSDYNRFELSFKLDNNDLATTEKKDFFAPSQFFAMSDADKISKDAYVKYRAGLAATTTENLSANHHVNRLVEYELEILDSKDNPPKKGVYIQSAGQMAHWAKASAIAKSELGLLAERQIVESGKSISLQDETFIIVNQSDLSPVESIAAGTEIELQTLLNNMILENPEKESELMVVSSYEIL